jgi:hypothetical protein
MKKDKIIRDKSFAFALNIIALYKILIVSFKIQNKFKIQNSEFKIK